MAKWTGNTRDFLLHHNIQFTVESETEGHLPFLDIDVQRDSKQ
jgi:hypothetical protein